MKKIVAMASIAMLWTSGAWALGTEAGTSIGNDATLSYSAGGVQQPDVNATIPAGQSSADEFVVDKKIDMVLVTTDSDQIDVSPGQTGRVTHYQFRNEGNADQNFTFSVSNLSNNEEADYDNDADNEDVSNMVIECTGGTPSPATSTTNGTITVEVAQDTNLTCTVKADIPDAAHGGADGDIMNIELLATAVDSSGNAETNTTGSDNKNSVDTVLADGTSGTGLGGSSNGKGDSPQDGKEAARSGYIVKTPVLDATKLSCVLNDPINNTTNPKRIPGATIIYVFDINNTGTLDATDINLTDTLQGELDGNGVAHIWIETNTTRSATPPCKCTDGNDMHSGSGSAGSDTDGSPQGIKIENIEVGAGKHTCVSFEVLIN